MTKRQLVELLVATGEKELKGSELRVAVLEQFKYCARTKYECIADILDLVAPFLIRESSVYAVKHAATRAVIHVLAVNTDPNVLQAYDGPTKAELTASVKSLLKQKADSDEEEVGHRVF